jgi:hypothetical protein
MRMSPIKPRQAVRAAKLNSTLATIVFGSQPYDALHRVRVARVKARGDVGGADQRHHLVIHAVANELRPETFAHV